MPRISIAKRMSFEEFVTTFQDTVPMNPAKKTEFLAKEYKRNLEEIDKAEKAAAQRDIELAELIKSFDTPIVIQDEDAE